METKFFSRLPENFKQNISGLHGAKGESWLRNLPDSVAEISEKWSITVEDFFPNLSYNYVAPCVCADGTEAVLKIGVPEDDSIVKCEASYLKLLGGNGAVKLLEIDEEHCVLLLEKLIPGESLKGICQIDDERATQIAVHLLRRIRREVPAANKFPTLESWAKGFQKAERINFAPDAVKKAQEYFAELNGASSRHSLLHGDFHHQNILSAKR
ncbi:MAG TPA: aminoglycoside phosphotransferase family protein, partial [Pyrinomonadaceae bacterium]